VAGTDVAGTEVAGADVGAGGTAVGAACCAGASNGAAKTVAGSGRSVTGTADISAAMTESQWKNRPTALRARRCQEGLRCTGHPSYRAHCALCRLRHTCARRRAAAYTRTHARERTTNVTAEHGQTVAFRPARRARSLALYATPCVSA
jgi:hypothetical protein